MKSNKMQEIVAKNGWELIKVARIGRSRSLYGQKRVEGGVGQSREPKLSVCCLHNSAHPFLAKKRPGAPVFGHFPNKYVHVQQFLRSVVHPLLLRDLSRQYCGTAVRSSNERAWCGTMDDAGRKVSSALLEAKGVRAPIPVCMWGLQQRCLRRV